MGGGKQPSTTTQISKVELPKWVEKASQENYDFAKQIAAKPLVQYGGQTVAGVSPATQSAWDLIQGGNQQGDDLYGVAANYFANGAQTVTPRSLASTDLSPYMNPYQQEVIDRSLADLDRNTQLNLGQNADKATAAGAFGGTRGAIVDAITRSESNKSAGDLSAQLRNQNFGQAQAAATGDISREFQGALAGQQAQLAAGSGFQGMGDSSWRNYMQNYMGLSDAGTKQQGQQQAELDAAKGKFDEASGYDLERLNILLSSLGMSPYGKTQTTQTTQPKQGTDWAQAGLGIFSMLGGIFSSDRNLKTDIKKLGKDPVTGLNMYAYRYKGDPKNYPKVVGPMAQEVEKKFKGATMKVGDYLAVDGSKILGALADA
jgi:hypothetical protein